jgi:hypothetical protein
MCRTYLTLLLACSLLFGAAPLTVPAHAQETQPGASKPAAQTPQPAQVPPKQTPAPQTASTPTPAPPLDKQSRKIMRVVLNAGLGGRLTVFLNNGEELHGAVSQIGADSFVLAEVDRHDLFTILYRDVRKARTGYDGISLFTGQRVSRPRGVKFAGFAIGLFAAVGLPLILVAASRD